jgi:hypothetical protein
MNRKELLAQESDGLDISQITEEDIRFYHEEGSDTYVPSVTTILSVFPKIDLQYWRDKVGAEVANKIGYEAAVSGTKVHNAIEDLCKQLIETGEGYLDWLDVNDYKQFKAYEWEGILRFADFYNNHVERIISVEDKLVSTNLFVGGMVDMVCELVDGRVALIDHKFSNGLADTYSIQTWVYKQMYEEVYGIQIDVRANLWLKAQTKGADKTGKTIQGKGWKLVEHTEDELDKMVFDCCHKIFMYMNRAKKLIPQTKQYPRTIKLTTK